MSYWMLDMVGDYLTRAKGLSKTEKQKVNEIVRHALGVTKTFIARNRNNGGDEPSQILSTTWQEASNKLRALGDINLRQFAEMLEEKSKYWSDPIGYDMEEISNYDIRLVTVENELKSLIA